MKGLKIAGKVLLGVIVALTMILAMLHLLTTAAFFDFFDHAKGEFLIPGLDTPFVPQGFDYLEEEDCFLICGYMSDGSASRVYVKPESGEEYSVAFLQEDGSAYTGHAGGVCHNGEYVYLAGKGGVEVFSLADILAGRDARRLGQIPTGYDMAYCSFSGGYLLSGNFCEEPGDQNAGLLTVFRADAGAELGIDATPVAAVSTPGRVQGLCVAGEEIVLSTSYSVDFSHLTYYRLDRERVGSVEVLGGQVPLYYLDSACQTHRVTLPPMSEELVYKDGRVWVMNESACHKYFYGKFIRGYQVFAYEKE